MKYSELTAIETKNIEAFSSDKVVTQYAKLVKKGLFTHEKKAIRKYFTKHQANILDLGCGTGRTTWPLHNIGFNVVGVDISEPMIQQARSMFPEVNFHTGNACKLDFDNQQFDYVLFSFNGIDCILPEEKRVMALREIHRVLKREGILVFSSHNSWYFIPAHPLHPLGYLGLLKFFGWNIRHRQVLSTYKIDAFTQGKYVYYFGNPLKQRSQLETCGFDLVDMIGNHRGILRYFEAWPYYVARKR